ncbi:uncharacterized protein BT62DRAFT_968672 [Guyanagaster necrorhizus]|uniref:BTB domain-containing protein n=1 Tax=Guyanagaster necrorhizus TaxID=856835 RepID=A0A9P8ATH0_9AGAR|nr:uncharacterized protein BT62DRAFT_968672 [Guyanagaster necrorhizus MCA 3950]KAG7445882.1 hypothetical protein BT62DRAFT_968672 [Guyanagaster necrorhizus MCA 3950]
MSRPADLFDTSGKRRHPVFWFPDGLTILGLEDHLFRVHTTVLCRHSPYFLGIFEDASAVGKQEDSSAGLGGCTFLDLDSRQVSVVDLVSLLEHLYHDVPLASSTDFSRIASLLRITSKEQLDFPMIHELARHTLRTLFPEGPIPYFHSDHSGEALDLATKYQLEPLFKRLFYTVVTTAQFHEVNEPDAHSNGTPINIIISTENSRRCEELMADLINHFTPILFTPPATSHMACTDVFADKWMPLVIQPALEDDGVYKPLESLERIKLIDWGKEGLCTSCVKDKKVEWTEEQETVWNLIDGWLGLNRT